MVICKSLMNHRVYFVASDSAFQKQQRRLAQELKKTQWWKNQLAKGVCYFCKRRFHPKELTMDHIIPIARGGKSTKSNVRPACRECNHKRRYLLPEEWALEKAYANGLLPTLNENSQNTDQSD